MKIHQHYPIVDAHGFLERAFLWLDSEDAVGIFYAALDLRFAFERTLIKHGFASTNYSKSFEKNNWQPRKLYVALGKEFSQKINLNSAYVFFFETDRVRDIFGYYLPIPEELFSSYSKLDKYLHAQWAIPIRFPEDKWRKEHAQELRVFAERLIPHANPKNSLDFLSLPSIRLEKAEVAEVENILKANWPTYFGV
ncbi:MAG: hypothetical protein HYZ26_01055 [Chloroflexi bacterium]|nr:hypothetical protein [Chloroflexota bacterium]